MNDMLICVLASFTQSYYFSSSLAQIYHAIMTKILPGCILATTITGTRVIIHELSLDRLEPVWL